MYKMIKVFIDGHAGTTGLRIHERLAERDDIELLQIEDSKRKDTAEIKKFINESDVTFLCLPDDAAREAVALLDKDNKKTKIRSAPAPATVSATFFFIFIDILPP